MSSKLEHERKSFLVSILRRATYKWKYRTEIFRRARIARGLYKCNACGNVFPPKEISADHITPVIDPLLGWQGFDVYVERMFCATEGFQILCKECHDKKTKEENEQRQLTKAKE